MIRDLILYTVIGFVIAIILVVSYLAYSLMNAEFQAITELNSTMKDRLNEWDTTMPQAWDFAFAFIIFAFAAGIIIMSYYLASQPVMFVVFWLISMILSIVAGYLSNAFDAILLDEVMGNAALSFPITTFIMDNYLVFSMVLGFAMIFVFVAKPNEAGY